MIAKPLTELTKKNCFCRTHEAQTAFDRLKAAMEELPTLAVPDFSNEFILETDASSQGLGAVLSQGGKPIALFSPALSSRAQRKSIYERELMAIVLAVQKRKHYLLGRHFVIMMDQRSLKFLTDQWLLGEDQFRWTCKLIGFDFKIQYRPGLENKAVDALSRQMMYKAISIAQASMWDTIDFEVQADTTLMQVVQGLQQGTGSFPRFSLQQGRLFYQERVVLPRNSTQIPVLLDEFHNTASGGHSRFLRTYKKVAASFYWKGMCKDIKEFVANCQICQQNKYESLSFVGLLNPLPIAAHI